MRDGLEGFPEDDFDLERLKRQMIMRKRKNQRRFANSRQNYSSRSSLLGSSKPVRVRNWKQGADISSLRSEKLASLRALTQKLALENKSLGHKEESSFDLYGYKKVVLNQKRENFWRRNARLFSVLSTLIMIVLFVFGFYFLTYAAHFIASLPFVR
jgi:Mg2+ and Co2+ transporter CorA